MTLTDSVIKKIIHRLFQGDDYRVEVLALINAEFLQYAIDFFRRIVEAKLRNQDLTSDWYKTEFLNDTLSKEEIIIHSGLNEKTISNMYNTARREVVIEAAIQHYDQLYDTIQSLVEQGNDVNVQLTIKLRGVSVDLTLSESLIVINTLAVKRAQLRGGAWSAAGKRVEKPLMLTLCKLYNVPSEHYELSGVSGEGREVDFYLVANGNRYLCEVKLMGKGNPESADATIARNSDIFIADKLSDLNKQQLNQRGVRWVELRKPDGYTRFETILDELGIPHTSPPNDIYQRVEEILNEAL